MQFGLHALGIGTGADPDVIAAVARAAERSGFARLWAGEHVVMVDSADSRYPYTPDGRIAVPSVADWLDPFTTLTFAAAATLRIRLATGVLLLAEHNPLIVAKQAASLDVLSGGRFDLGIGIGWSRNEFAALGVPFEERIPRVREYVEAMRALWSTDVTGFAGRFVDFAGVRSYPKPVRAGRVPVIVGGNSDAALDRVADYGDGWYGFSVAPDDLNDRLAVLMASCRQRGVDPHSLDIAVDLGDAAIDPLELERIGVTERVIVASPPGDAAEVDNWIEDSPAPMRYLGHSSPSGAVRVRLIVSGVFDRHPDLQLVLGHWGELLLFWQDRTDSLSRIAGLQRKVSEYVRTNVHITSSGMLNPTLLRHALDVTTPDRLLFSTDYPFQRPTKTDLTDFRAAFPTDEDRNKFLNGNARSLFGIGAVGQES